METSTSVSSSEITEKTIDVEQVFRAKNPRLYRWTPRFVVKWVARLIWQDEINRIIFTYPDDTPVTFARHILEEFRVNIQVVGRENLHDKERFIVASNHPLGGLDGVAMLDTVGAIYPDVIFPVNDMLLFIPQFRTSFIPISKQGSNISNTANLKNIQAHFSSNHPILYFPAGLCSRKQRGEIKDLEWKKSFITLAMKYKRDIIPAFFQGRNSGFFYRLSNIRKWFGVKFNIELIFLPKEMFRQQGKTFQVVFGKPIPCSFFDERHTQDEWAQLLREFVYTLKTGDETFESFVDSKTK
jgi:putative hemolysin